MATPSEIEANTNTISTQPVIPVAEQIQITPNPAETPSAAVRPLEQALPTVVTRECNGIMPRTVEDFRNVTFNIVNKDQPRVYFHTQPNDEPQNQSTAYLVPEDAVVVLPSQVPDQNGFRCVSYMASKTLYNGQPKQTNGWMPISALYALPKADRIVVDPLNNVTGADLSQSELVHINPFGQMGNFAVIPNTFENSTYGFVMEASADELATGKTNNRYESPIKRPISASEFEQFMKTQSACAMFAKMEMPFHIMVMTGRCDGEGGKDTMVYENFMPQPKAKVS